MAYRYERVTDYQHARVVRPGRVDIKGLKAHAVHKTCLQRRVVVVDLQDNLRDLASSLK